MEFEELKTKNITELNELLNEQVALLRDFRFKLANQQLKTVGKIKEARKTVARIKMLLNRENSEAQKK